MIFANIGQIIPKEDFHRYTFIDGFSGGGSVSFIAKAFGFKEVLFNDWGYMNYQILNGIINNSHVLITDEDILQIYELYKSGHTGFV